MSPFLGLRDGEKDGASMGIRGVGIVGTGVVFSEHAAALARLDQRLRLVGVAEVDRHRRRAATDTAFVPFATDDYRTLLDRPEVDVVVVCTPPSAHEEVVAAALAAGKHVVCEKPLATNLAAVDRLIALAETSPGRLSTVYQWRYIPEVRRIVHLRDTGRLGRLVLGRFQRLARIPSGHAGAGWWGRWDVAGGGVVMTQAVHEVDLMLHLFGPPLEVNAEMATLSAAIESEDTCVATVRFVSGAMAVLVASVATHEASSQFDVVGEHASVHFPWRLATHDQRVARQLLDEANSAVPTSGRSIHPELVRLQRKVGRVVPRLRPPAPPPMHLGYWAQVADALDRDAPLPVGPEEARRSVELVTAIYTSALRRRPVMLPLSADDEHVSGVTKSAYERHRSLAAAAP
jgi:UDP-N-acetyl-2-amino-2-deoxyglucuronate dehydrogenase